MGELINDLQEIVPNAAKFEASVEENICKFAEKGLTPLQIGVILTVLHRNGAQKLLGILIAVAYVLAVICLDELLQKGYGLGSVKTSSGKLLTLLLSIVDEELNLKLLYRKYGENFLVNLLGKWKEAENSDQSIHVDGLAYYITAPSSLSDILANPFHGLFYIVFMLSACALFSKTWIEVSGSSVKDVVKQLKDVAVKYPSILLVKHENISELSLTEL
ncbi:hypothetical protein ACS0TY_024302 [Phlomoides rotata]